MAKRNCSIDMSTLYELMILGQRVDPFDLINTCEEFYVSIKAVGVEETTAFLYYSDEKQIVLKGKCIPEEIRGMAEWITILTRRWPDMINNNTTRLDVHYGLTRPLSDVLGDKVVKRDNNTLDILTIQNVIDTVVKLKEEERQKKQDNKKH